MVKTKQPMTKIEVVPSTPWTIIQSEKKKKERETLQSLIDHVNDNILSNVNPSFICVSTWN